MAAGFQFFQGIVVACCDLAFILILGGGANGQVSKGGAEKHHALGVRGGHRQDDGAQQFVGGLVKHHELALARLDGEGRDRRAITSTRSPKFPAALTTTEAVIFPCLLASVQSFPWQIPRR